MVSSRVMWLMSLTTLTVAVAADGAQLSMPVDGDSPNVPAGEIDDDLYTAGSSVSVQATVHGDLLAFGGSVHVGGSVDQDLVAAGGTVDLRGPVGDDVRAAGGVVTVAAPVQGDVVVAGGQVRLAREARVGGDLLIGAGQAVVEAPVAGKLRIAASEVRLDGEIAGAVEARGEKLVIGPSARLSGPLVWSGPERPRLEPGAQVRSIDFRRMDVAGRPSTAWTVALGLLVQMAAGILAGLVLVRVAGPTVQRAVADVWAAPWRDLGLGFVTLVVVPVAVILLLVSVVGYALAALAGMVWGLGLLLAMLLAAVFLGASVRRLTTHATSLPVDWKSVVLGVPLAVLLAALPILGWLAMFLLFLMAFGALVHLLRPRRPLPPPAHPTAVASGPAPSGWEPVPRT